MTSKKSKTAPVTASKDAAKSKATSTTPSKIDAKSAAVLSKAGVSATAPSKSKAVSVYKVKGEAMPLSQMVNLSQVGGGSSSGQRSQIGTGSMMGGSGMESVSK